VILLSTFNYDLLHISVAPNGSSRIDIDGKSHTISWWKHQKQRSSSNYNRMSDTFNLLAFINGNGRIGRLTMALYLIRMVIHLLFSRSTKTCSRIYSFIISGTSGKRFNSTICFYSARHIQCLMKYQNKGIIIFKSCTLTFHGHVSLLNVYDFFARDQ